MRYGIGIDWWMGGWCYQPRIIFFLYLYSNNDGVELVMLVMLGDGGDVIGIGWGGMKWGCKSRGGNEIGIEKFLGGSDDVFIVI